MQKTLTQKPNNISIPETARPESKGRFNILVADDDMMITELLREFLGGLEYGISTVCSGEEALERIRMLTIDIVLVDLKMQGMDGLKTIEKITAIDPEIVTILMTGYPTLDSSVQAIRLGASDYIVKPFKLNDVKEAVTKAIRQREKRLEAKNLKVRVSMLEQSLSQRKDSITVNKKLVNQSAN